MRIITAVVFAATLTVCFPSTRQIFTFFFLDDIHHRSVVGVVPLSKGTQFRLLQTKMPYTVLNYWLNNFGVMRLHVLLPLHSCHVLKHLSNLLSPLIFIKLYEYCTLDIIGNNNLLGIFLFSIKAVAIRFLHEKISNFRVRNRRSDFETEKLDQFLCQVVIK